MPCPIAEGMGVEFSDSLKPVIEIKLHDKENLHYLTSSEDSQSFRPSSHSDFQGERTQCSLSVRLALTHKQAEKFEADSEAALLLQCALFSEGGVR